MIGREKARIVIGALWLLCAPAVADEVIEPAGERPAQVERLDVSYVVSDDGSYTETREIAIKVLQAEALEAIKDYSIGYSTSIQKVEVLEAYTLKSDGRRVPVPKANYQVTTNGGHADGGPVFSDQTQMTVVFPELAVGDTTVFNYRLIGSQPLFDRQFSELETFDRSTYYGKVNVRFDAPASLPIRHEAWHLTQVRDDVVKGRRISEWRYANLKPIKQETTAALFQFEREPGLVYSTFADYQAIAQAYGQRATPKAAVTPRIQALADEIAGAKREPRDVAKALYEWVSTNITYAGNCIGLGAVVPHDLDFVLDNKMGDCKDHATLLQALLSAKGIDSTQALVNAGALFRLPRTPAVAMVNHVINYLPQWDLYLDATAKGIPFGMLSSSVAGKPVFRVAGYQEGTTTPWPRPDSSRQTVRTRMKVAADGSIDGETDIELSGFYAVNARAGFRSLTAQQVQDGFDRYVRRMGQDGTGSVELEDAKPLGAAYRYSLRFKAGQGMPMPGAIALQPIFPTEAPIMRFAAQANEKVDEERPTTCISGYSQEEYVIEFAAPSKVLAVPPSTELAGDAFSYKASYEIDGNTIRVKRILDDRTPGPICEPRYNREYRDFLKKVLTNLRAQVVYQ